MSDPFCNRLHGFKDEFAIAESERLLRDNAFLASVTISHRSFIEEGWAGVQALLKPDGGVVVDVKGALPRDSVPGNVALWRL